MATSFPIIDSHVHLWPASDANIRSHEWMTPEHKLAKQYSIDDYLAASHTKLSEDTNLGRADVRGFVYIETDRRLESRRREDLSVWAQEPLRELSWLRRIVEGQPNEGEGHLPEQSRLLLGIVPWAPIDSGTVEFRNWLMQVKAIAGLKTWARVKGFRYLLQGIKNEEKFRQVTLSEEWISVLKSFKQDGKEFSFDVGVDHHSGGLWQLEIVADMIEKVHENEDNKVTFILNHLCKPNLEVDSETLEGSESLRGWARCIQRCGRMEKVYMKLSGAFSELGNTNPEDPWPVSVIVRKLKPWLDILFKCFPAERIMFGSDWPVCNLGGPGDHLSWATWRAVVSQVLDEYQLSDEDKGWIWWQTAQKAYRLELP